MKYSREELFWGNAVSWNTPGLSCRATVQLHGPKHTHVIIAEPSLTGLSPMWKQLNADLLCDEEFQNQIKKFDYVFLCFYETSLFHPQSLRVKSGFRCHCSNKVNQFCPTVFNEKENARSSLPFEISSCRKISEDICMFRLSPAARPGG